MGPELASDTGRGGQCLHLPQVTRSQGAQAPGFQPLGTKRAPPRLTWDVCRTLKRPVPQVPDLG